MPNPENVAKHKFKKGQSGNPKGRPPKLINHINEQLKSEGFTPASKSQIVEAYLLIVQLPLEKIKEIQDTSTNYPILFKLIARELIGKRGSDILEKILDRGIGRTTEIIEATVKDETKRVVTLPGGIEIET